MSLMTTRVSASEIIKTTDRQRAWVADVFAALGEVEPDEELRDHLTRLLESMQEVEEVAVRINRESRFLQLETDQLWAEVDAEEGREPLPEPERQRVCSIEIVDSDAGPCIRCCQEVGGGLIGWRWQPESGPLCDRCLGDLDLELGTELQVVQRMRELSTWEKERSPQAMDELLELARAYHRATGDSWPLRPIGVAELLDGLVEQGGMERYRFARREGEGEPN